MIFGLTAPLLVGVISLSVDYAKSRQLEAHLRTAADAAALTATIAVSKGTTISDATTLAGKYWDTAMMGALGTASKPTVTITNTSGTVTTTVDFSGSSPTSFAKLLGFDSISVSGTTAATVSAATLPSKTYSGTGLVWGDPHIDGADKSTGDFNCPQPYWYNMLSDGGLEVNVACSKTGAYDLIKDFSVMLGTHVITMSGVETLHAYHWYDQVTIDGVPFNPGLGTTTLATWPEGTITAVINTTDPSKASDWIPSGAQIGPKANKIVITTPQYTLSLGYEVSDWEYGWMSVAAQNAGTCGAPGGLFGKTLSGVDDFNIADYQLPTSTSTSPEFARTPCGSSTATAVRLTK